MDYYQLLGVAVTATDEEIKAAYRALAKKFHPDKNPGNKQAEEYFKQITVAYDTLSDSDKKHRYDLKLRYGTVFQTYQPRQTPAPESPKKRPVRRPPPLSEKERKQERNLFWRRVAIFFLIVTGVTLFSKYMPREQSEYRHLIRMPSPAEQAKKEAELLSHQPVARKIYNADSPYDSYFGEGLIDKNSKNQLIVTNQNTTEVVVCLIKKTPDGTTNVVRNEYLDTGVTLKMNYIPDGNYFLTAYFGRKWNPDKYVWDSIQGGFDTSAFFCSYISSGQLLQMKQQKEGNTLRSATYHVVVAASDTLVNNKITAKMFFKK